MPINKLNQLLAFDDMPTFWILKPEHYNCDKYCVKIKNNFYDCLNSYKVRLSLDEYEMGR